MWSIKGKLGAGQTIGNLLCLSTSPAKAACTIVVNAFSSDIRHKISSGIATKTCLKIRVSMTPIPATMLLYRSYLVRGTSWKDRYVR